MLPQITNQIKESIQYKQNLLADTKILDNIVEIVSRINTAYKQGKKVLVFGNGGSAADAQHIAAELINKFRRERHALPAIALNTNTSVLTAISNDYEYNKVFERQVEALAEKGDVVIGISTSGNSLNVLLGLNAAKKKGAYTIALLGNAGGITLDVADLALVVPGSDTPRIQEVHIMLGHIICDLVETSLIG